MVSRLLLSRSKSISWVRFPRLEGLGPDKLLLERSRREREGRRARERGMEPERPQVDRLREVMW